jgi:hypothetical protein
MEEMLEMSNKEFDRYHIIQKVCEKQITQKEVGILLMLSAIRSRT